MPLLRRFLLHAAKRLALDPEARARAAHVLETEVKPRARAAWRRTKPKLDAARADLKDIAAETDPRKNPRQFAAKVKERFFGRG